MPAPLEIGDHGPRVTALQTRLNDLHFLAPDPTGNFLGATEAAVIAFQKSEGLLADGVVGKLTAEKLGLAVIPDAPSLSVITLDVVLPMFPDAKKANVEANLPEVIRALTARKLTNHLVALGALATIRAETAGFVPINEWVSKYNTSGAASHTFDLYDHRKDLGNTGPPDGALFKGRGFVQLTGRSNYKTFGPKVGVDLLSNPDLANDRKVAADLLAAFIKACEIKFKQALVDQDMAHARRLVNGGSHGLAEFTKAYETGAKRLIS